MTALILTMVILYGQYDCLQIDSNANITIKRSEIIAFNNFEGFGWQRPEVKCEHN